MSITNVTIQPASAPVLDEEQRA
ncbi:MAG: hypothetical protein JWM84_1530, partial [Nocardioides sp.]|nr:hypothetical protein [Nocardioides sp.]